MIRYIPKITHWHSCPYGDGGNVDKGDYWTPDVYEPANCKCGVICPFGYEEEHNCAYYHLQEGDESYFQELFCYEAKLKDGKVFCSVSGKECDKLDKIEECDGDKNAQFVKNCPFQIHDSDYEVIQKSA